jgi:hypothetical protein
MIEDKGLNQKLIRNLVIGLGLAFAFTTLFNYGYSYFTGVDYSKLLTTEWRVEKFGRPFIRIATPVELHVLNKELSREANDFVENQQIFSYQAGHDLTITLIVVRYHPDVYFDPEGAEKSIQNFEKLFGAKNISF